MFVEIINSLAGEVNFALVRAEQTDDVFKENGLACAAGAEDDGGVASCEIEADPGEDAELAEGFVNVAKLEKLGVGCG